MPRSNLHIPVLLSEIMTDLITQPDGIYIDGTFGRGGHSLAILEKLNDHGRLYIIDKDPEAIAFAKICQKKDKRLYVFQGSFDQIEKIAEQEKITGKVSGILLDLGVSSPQLDTAERGFSFKSDGPLDMRMDPEHGISVAKWLQTVKQENLAHVIKEYGEERFAKRIAKAIVTARSTQAITTTKQLANIIAEAHPAWEREKHPATRTFQALRIYINQELNALSTALPQCLRILKKGGRLAVISFHSLEDRIVKRFIQEEIQGDKILKKLPIQDRQLQKRLRCIGRSIRPSSQETEKNPRARSAILRIVEKLT